jgi:hypothetical protein
MSDVSREGAERIDKLLLNGDGAVSSPPFIVIY